MLNGKKNCLKLSLTKNNGDILVCFKMIYMNNVRVYLIGLKYNIQCFNEYLKMYYINKLK